MLISTIQLRAAEYLWKEGKSKTWWPCIVEAIAADGLMTVSFPNWGKEWNQSTKLGSSSFRLYTGSVGKFWELADSSRPPHEVSQTEIVATEMAKSDTGLHPRLLLPSPDVEDANSGERDDEMERLRIANLRRNQEVIKNCSEMVVAQGGQMMKSLFIANIKEEVKNALRQHKPTRTPPRASKKRSSSDLTTPRASPILRKSRRLSGARPEVQLIDDSTDRMRDTEQSCLEAVS